MRSTGGENDLDVAVLQGARGNLVGEVGNPAMLLLYHLLPGCMAIIRVRHVLPGH